MASHRLPRDLEWVKTPSRCPDCAHRLHLWDLFPVFSWLSQKGKCRYCQVKISARYPLTEIITGLLFVLVTQQVGISALAVILLLFSTALVIMVVADLETCLIPDEIHWMLLPLGIAFHFQMQNDFVQVLTTALTGLFLGLLLHYGYYWLRGKHGLGLGDVKFLAVAGLWLGSLHHLVVFIFYSGLIGIAIGVIWRLVTKEERFPFGPALALSLFMLTVYPETGNWFWLTLQRLLVN